MIYLTSYKILKHHISLYTGKYSTNVSQWENEEINKNVTKLKDGIIQPSNSVSNSPLTVVSKKEVDKDVDKKTTFLIDYRKLNESTISDNYPIPLIQTTVQTPPATTKC